MYDLGSSAASDSLPMAIAAAESFAVAAAHASRSPGRAEKKSWFQREFIGKNMVNSAMKMTVFYP